MHKLYFPNKILGHFIKLLAFFVLTSEWEGFANIIVEALACGTPVVSTDCPGGPRFILDDGKYGLLIKPNDKDELESALIALLTQSITFKEEDLVKMAKDFSVENIGRDYMEVIKNA